ncbi:hypothetical protein [Streptomyces sp. NPDC017448]|uniref:T4 family baseplate hub assembly chaperone n=1 Tax=Streptomyces sp. NPDC017448 TaxID=3364996 RepID=UPI0037995BF3
MVDPQWDFDAIGGEATSVEDALSSPESVNAQVAQVLSESVGEAPLIPLPEDDRVTLGGGLYWDGELVTHAQVREMTGEDEEALARVKGSLARWLSMLLERTVVRLGDEPATPKAIRRLLIGDRDELVLGVRIATFGKHITAQNVQCPHCDEYFDAKVDLTRIDRVSLEEVKPRHEYTVELRAGKSAVVRLPDGAAQESIFENADATIPERNSLLLAACLVSVTKNGVADTRTGVELAKALSVSDRRTLIRFISETQPGPLLDDIRFDHEACGKEVRLTLELPDLFRGE